MNDQRVGGSADGTRGRVTVECTSFRGFLESFVPRVEEEGIFLPTETPRSVGESVEFVVGLGADFPILRGAGEVVWSIEPDTADGWPAGIAVRFEDIDPPTEVMVTMMVENARTERALPLFSLDRPPARIDRPPAAADESIPRPRPWIVQGGVLSWAASILVGLALGVVGYRLQGATTKSSGGAVETQVVVAEPASSGGDREMVAAAGAMDFLEREPSAAAAQIPQRRAGEIEGIEWVAASDSTRVIVSADAPWAADSYEIERVAGGAPRVVVKLAGVSLPPYPSLEVGSEHVERLRLGLHGSGEARRVHIVVDLADERVELVRVAGDGAKLELRFAPDGD